MTNYEMIKRFTPQHFAQFIMNPFPLIRNACNCKTCPHPKEYKCEDCITEWLLTERKEVHKIENDKYYKRLQEIAQRFLTDEEKQYVSNDVLTIEEALKLFNEISEKE